MWILAGRIFDLVYISRYLLTLFPNSSNFDFERSKQSPLRQSQSFLRKSNSSFDLQFHFVRGQLGAVKELDDEHGDLTIPFEPKEDEPEEQPTIGSPKISPQNKMNHETGGKRVVFNKYVGTYSGLPNNPTCTFTAFKFAILCLLVY